MLKDLDTDFELQRVELQADKEAKVATAEAEYQKNWSALFLRPEGTMNKDALQETEKQGKAYADALFRIKKEAALASHKEHMANVQKNTIS